MPEDPVPLARARASNSNLWIGLDFNAANAGFRDVRVTLPCSSTTNSRTSRRTFGAATLPCRGRSAATSTGSPTSTAWTDDEDRVGRIDDTTDHLTRSGSIRFTVPRGIGPIATWAPLPRSRSVRWRRASRSNEAARQIERQPFTR
jgi:hypothetical protein